MYDRFSTKYIFLKKLSFYKYITVKKLLSYDTVFYTTYTCILCHIFIKYQYRWRQRENRYGLGLWYSFANHKDRISIKIFIHEIYCLRISPSIFNTEMSGFQWISLLVKTNKQSVLVKLNYFILLLYPSYYMDLIPHQIKFIHFSCWTCLALCLFELVLSRACSWCFFVHF